MKGLQIVCLAAAACLAVMTPRAGAQTIRRVAGALDNPQGLAFGPEGGRYVAEAGTGSAGPCFTNANGGNVCYGPTGSVTRIDLRRGGVERIATGLPSLAGAVGTAATGPHDGAFRGRWELQEDIGAFELPVDPAAHGPDGEYYVGQLTGLQFRSAGPTCTADGRGSGDLSRRVLRDHRPGVRSGPTSADREQPRAGLSEQRLDRGR